MIVNNKNKKQYEIELPNGKIVKGVWFIGKQLLKDLPLLTRKLGEENE